MSLSAAVFVATSAICSRKMTHYSSKISFWLVPFGFSLGNIVLCPLFMIFKIVFFPISPHSKVLTEKTQTPGVSLHVFSFSQCIEMGMILLLAVAFYFSQIFQAQAFRYEKAGRVAPILYLSIILSCIADVVLFETKITWNQMIGGLIIIVSNFTIAVLKCLEIVK